MLRAGGPDEKEQLACAMHELKVVVHEVVSPAGLLEAKNAPMERKKSEANGQRSDWIEQREENYILSFLMGVEKVVFLMQNPMG